MAEIYRLYTEADYDAITKVTGAGQAQAWDAASQLGGGGSGDIAITLNGSTNPVYAQCPLTGYASLTASSHRFYYNVDDLTIPSTNRFVIAWMRNESANNPTYIFYHYNLSGTPTFRVITYEDGATSAEVDDTARTIRDRL